MSDEIEEISAGDTSPVWEVGFATSVEGELPLVLADLDVNFTCRLSVLNSEPPIDKVIVTKNVANNRFRAWLTPTETLALGKGRWKVGIQISNPALNPPLVKEEHITLKIITPYVPNV